VDDLQSQGVPVAVIQVENVGVDDVRLFLADTLQSTTEDTGGLAALIYAKTRGNPFFVRSLLGYLGERDLIWFETAHNCWQWRTDGIREDDLPADVVQLFVRRLHHLDAERRELFSLAACLGNRFDMAILSIISGHPRERCLALLFSGQARTMLLPFDDAGSVRDDKGFQAPEVGTFLHDRVQQAAYSLIDPAELPTILLKIGRLLLASLRPEQLDERLFEVVGDLNAAHQLIGDTTERVRMVELNVAAARKAYAATAYRSALQFYRAANHLLEDTDFAEHVWANRHELTMQLFQERAECEFLEGNHTEAEACVQQAVAHAGTAIEKANALNTLIIHYTLLARYPDAIAAGRQGLAALGISLPEGGYEEARDQEIARARQELGSRSISSLIELPVMSDPAMLMASRILITMGPPCYRSHQRLWGVIVPKVVSLTLRYGNIPQVGYSHPAFGGLLCWVDDDYATAREFGELATRLMSDTFKSPSDQSVFYLMIGSSIRHWFKHLRHSTQDYMDAYEIGLRSSNLQYAAYAFGHNMYCRFYQGVPMETLIQESLRSLLFSRTRLNQWAIDLIEGGLDVFGALSSESPASNGSDSWSEEGYLQRVEDHHNVQVACIYKVLKAFSSLILGDHGRALILSEEAEPLIYTVGTQGLLPWPEHVFARLLIITALYSTADRERQATWRPELDHILGRLRTWADNCPENYEHKYYLAAAELARIDGSAFEAMQLYDKAVEAALAGGFLQWEAVANERAYGFWLEWGSERIAHVYWQQAYSCYERWGAAAKVRAMETAYRAYLADRLAAAHESGKSAGAAEQEAENALLETQTNQLRKYAFYVRQDKLKLEAATQAEELAKALERLRAEVTGRKRVEQSLRESEARYRQSIELTGQIGWATAADGQVDDLPAWRKYTGQSLEEVKGWGWLAALHPDDKERTAHAWQESVDSKSSYEVEYRVRGRGGAYRPFVARGVPVLDDEGSIEGWVGVCIDITDRKQAEEERFELERQMQHGQKLESLGVLAGGIAHDFNNILTTVIGNAELALSELSPSAPARENLLQIMQASHRAAALSRQMLAYSGRGHFVTEAIDLGALIEDMIDLLKSTVSKRALLTLHLEENLAPLEGDPSQLGQVIMNLVLNASEALGDKDGVITVSTGTQECSAEYLHQSYADLDLPPGVYLTLDVCDTGCGMDAETQERLFEPFFTTKFTGRGLGLAAVLGIVRGHRGALRVSSEPGKGTTFKILLPVSAAKAVAPLPGTGAPAADWQGVGTVLLVDDEETIRALGERMLSRLGFRVLTAADGPEALSIYARHRDEISLVLLDLTMPHMDGEETFRELSRLDPEVRVVISSGYTEQDISSRFAGKGMAGFVQKPYSLAQLKEQLRMATTGIRFGTEDSIVGHQTQAEDARFT
jgi:PAS domain S-box-containing protein